MASEQAPTGPGGPGAPRPRRRWWRGRERDRPRHAHEAVPEAGRDEPQLADDEADTEPDPAFGVRLEWPAESHAEAEAAVDDGPELRWPGDLPAGSSGPRREKRLRAAPTAQTARIGRSPSGHTRHPESVGAAEAPSQGVVASRVESVHGAVSATSMRIDSLVAAVASLRSALSDRLDEYAERVTTMARTHADEAADDRANNERFAAHVQGSLADAEAGLRRLLSAVNGIDGVTALLSEQLEELQANTKDLGPALDRMGNDVLEATDALSERISAQVSAASALTTDTLAGIRDDLKDLGPALDRMGNDVLEATDALGERISAQVSAASALTTDTLAGIRDDLVVVRQGMSVRDGSRQLLASFAELGSQLASLREEVVAALGDRPPSQVTDEVGDELRSLRDELARLKRRIPVRARDAATLLPANDLRALADAFAAAIPPAQSPAVTDEQVDAIVSAVVDRLLVRFEVVDEPPAAQSPAGTEADASGAPTAGAGRGRRRRRG